MDDHTKGDTIFFPHSDLERLAKVLSCQVTDLMMPQFAAQWRREHGDECNPNVGN